jgi:4-hydroxybenzoate polyprenyltransferase
VGLATYFCTALLYSVYLKSKAVADVITLAILYALRVLMGGFATGITISTWLIAFSMFLFLALAFVKRFAELDSLKLPVRRRVPGRSYMATDKEWMMNMGSTSGYLSVLVLALYISSEHVTELYSTPALLWLACPVLLYWVSRLWLVTSRGEMRDDPIVFAMKDRVSWAFVFVICVIQLMAMVELSPSTADD